MKSNFAKLFLAGLFAIAMIGCEPGATVVDTDDDDGGTSTTILEDDDPDTIVAPDTTPDNDTNINLGTGTGESDRDSVDVNVNPSTPPAGADNTQGSTNQ